MLSLQFNADVGYDPHLQINYKSHGLEKGLMTVSSLFMLTAWNSS